MVKYWDADRFEQILLLPGHCSCVWGIDISFEGAVCVSVGGDRTLRVWKRGEEMVFIEEEKERALEAQIDAEADRGASNAIVNVNGVEPTAAASADSAKVHNCKFVSCATNYCMYHTFLFREGSV